MRTLLLTALLLAACSGGKTLVVATALVPGGGGAGTSTDLRLDILVRLQADATDFNPWDLMRLYVDGIERTREIVIGGSYALLRIDPVAEGPHHVELYGRTGPRIDSYTWNVQPVPGPVVTSVTPDTARVESQVVIAGSGFDGGALRVFFGGAEGAVDASTATTISATVPTSALPGPLWVLVGERAAEGLVGFQPLDAADQPVAAPSAIRLAAASPGSGAREAVIDIYGHNFTNLAVPMFGSFSGSRLFGVESIELPPAGTIRHAFAVVYRHVDPPTDRLFLRELYVDSNELPFTVLD